MGKTNRPRFVTYVENPQLAFKLEAFCKQNRCSTSTGINYLLEQALGLTSLDDTANVPSASTSKPADDAAQRELIGLKREIKDLRSAVNELRVNPSAMPSASTAHISASTSANTANSTAKLVDGTLASTLQAHDSISVSTADNTNDILSKIDEFKSHFSRKINELEERILTQQNDEHQEIANHLQELLDWKEEIENQEDENIDIEGFYSPADETIQSLQNEIMKLSSELEQAKLNYEKYYRLWHYVFPNSLAYKDITTNVGCTDAWVRTGITRDEAYKVFIK